MSRTKTLLTIFVHPDDMEHALYLIGETLKQGDTRYAVQTGAEERIVLDIAQPFMVTHRQTQLLFALESPPTHHQLQEIAGEAITGLIYGFTVKGEINLGEDYEDYIINNLGGLAAHHSRSELMKDLGLA